MLQAVKLPAGIAHLNSSLTYIDTHKKTVAEQTTTSLFSNSITAKLLTTQSIKRILLLQNRFTNRPETHHEKHPSPEEKQTIFFFCKTTKEKLSLPTYVNADDFSHACKLLPRQSIWVT
jgi:hypothetical protein